jgi:hypothetical protein
MPVPDSPDALRAELLRMRGELIARLRRRIDGGDLALLSTVQGAIGALAADAAERVEGIEDRRR